MKKTFRLLGVAILAVMSFGITSCGGDDDDEKDDGIDTTPITLIAGKDKTIQGADTISSSNKFVAYATKNTVHGWHVGEAALKVNGKKTISITVLPQYYLYDNPVLEWGCSIDKVKMNQKQGTINSKSTDEMLAYDNAGGATLMAYNFKNGKLNAVMAIISTNHTSTLASYLAERYLMLPMYQGEDAYFAGCDNIDVDSANTFVIMQLYSTKYWAVYYTQSSKSTTRSNIMNSHELRDMLMSFVNK